MIAVAQVGQTKPAIAPDFPKCGIEVHVGTAHHLLRLYIHCTYGWA